MKSAWRNGAGLLVFPAAARFCREASNKEAVAHVQFEKVACDLGRGCQRDRPDGCRIGRRRPPSKVVMHSDLKILDPIWTTAYIVRNHGYLVWDTLFAMDEKFDVKPQMVDKYDVSADKLVWTFTLRDGLEWHDGKPVTRKTALPRSSAGRHAI